MYILSITANSQFFYNDSMKISNFKTMGYPGNERLLKAAGWGAFGEAENR